MEYITPYKIFIEATPQRRREIAERILDINHWIDPQRQRKLDKFEQNGFLRFSRKWFDWEKDLRVSFEFVGGQFVKRGIPLNDGESIRIEAEGEEEDDYWKAFLSKTKFSVKHCLRVEYHDRRPGCVTEEGEDDDGNALICTGCRSCATPIPIYR